MDELVVALETVDNSRLMDILYSLYCYKRPIKILADKSSSLSQVKIKAIKGVPLVDVTDNKLLAHRAECKCSLWIRCYL